MYVQTIERCTTNTTRLLRTVVLPTLIVGDLASIDARTLGYFKGLGVAAVADPNEHYTDVEKALQHLRTDVSQLKKGKYMKTVVVYDGAGRHWNKHLALIHTLFAVCTTNAL